MRNLVYAAVLMALGTGNAVAQDAEIKGTISQQFEAFKADDFAGAFEFASPNLQRLFQNPENFGRMVTQGYPMVWRPADVRFLELREEGGVYRQMVLVRDGHGTNHVLEYRMLETTDGWRINGVQILKDPGATA
ncbi:DUF4864 domain-containing protein [Blastomonas sp.]|uniref:DUF4864 domain-containing protein n=1 Tax=Blastomonas sp. TaxID=1909299 RepID=UPI003594478D